MFEAEGVAGVRTGNMKGWGTPRLRVVMGESSTRRHLRRDWVLVHEMVHTAFPDVPDRHNWIEEGLGCMRRIGGPNARHRPEPRTGLG